MDCEDTAGTCGVSVVVEGAVAVVEVVAEETVVVTRLVEVDAGTVVFELADVDDEGSVSTLVSV